MFFKFAALFARTLLLYAALLSAAGSAMAAPRVKITRANKALFTLLARNAPFFACYAPPQSAARLGTISERKIRSGVVWTEYQIQNPQSQLRSVSAKLERLRNRHKTRTSQYKDLTRRKKSLESAIRKAIALEGNCEIGSDGEFKGDPLSLGTYRNKLSRNEVRHLLDKVALGGSPELEAIGVTQGLGALVDTLLDGPDDPSARDQLEADSMVWARRGFYFDDQDPDYQGIRIWNIDALQAAQFYRFIYSRTPLHEWLLLMLSGHFATNLNAIDFSYSKFGHYGLPLHWELLKSHVLGNFKTLSKKMFRDPAMNEWLDNKDNHVGNPNQNFARELLELFTLGAIDPVSGAKNYDEESVVAATGFASGFYEGTQIDPESGKEVVDSAYSDDLHDFEARTLFRGIAAAEVTAPLTADQLVDQILDKHPGSARYIVERFAGQMLYPGLNESMVRELAEDLRTGNFELRPLVKKIISSQAMFSEAARNACIASPIERTVRLARRILKKPLPRDGENLDKSYYLLLTLRDTARDAGQSVFEPPSVFGWKGACNINRAGQKFYGEGWLSEQRVLNRSRSCGDLMGMLAWIEYDLADALDISSYSNAELIVSSIADNLFNISLTPAETAVLVNFMTTERNNDGSTSSLEVNPRETGYVWRKVARLVCLLADLSASNLR